MPLWDILKFLDLFLFLSLYMCLCLSVAYVPQRPEMDIKFLEVIGSCELPAGNETQVI